MIAVSLRSARVGALVAAVLSTFYVAVVWGASRSSAHLVDQVRADWYYLAPITVGFGVQVGLIAEMRRRHRAMSSAAAAGGAGAGASTAGMVACCAHHLADVAPVLGATGVAAFLTDYRIVFMVVGIGVNAVGIAVAARKLRAMQVHHEEAHVCSVAA